MIFQAHFFGIVYFIQFCYCECTLISHLYEHNECLINVNIILADLKVVILVANIYWMYSIISKVVLSTV